jgi:outer membrane protein TolC
MFPWFGVLKNAKDEMSLMANAKFEVFRDSKLQVYYDVYRTWNELVKIRKDIEISEKNIEILKVIERLALIRFKAAPVGGSSSQNQPMQGSAQANINAAGTPGMRGMTGVTGNAGNNSSNQYSSMQNGSMEGSSPSGLADIYRIQIEAGDLHNNISSLKNQEQTAQAQFNSLLNRHLSSHVTTVDTLIADNSEFNYAIIADSIIAKNPMLGMLDYEKQSYAARKKMVNGMSKPMVGLGLNYTLINKSATPMVPDMNGRDMIMPMITVTLPIYRKKYNAMQKEADLMGIAASQNYESTANALKTELYQAIQLYEDANRRVGLYAKQFQLASKSLELSLKSFSTSSSGLTEVLRIRQQTLNYELLRVQAVADLNSSVAWLRRLASSQIK